MRFFLAAIALVCALSAVFAGKYTKEEEERIFNNWLKRHKIKVPDDEAGKKWKENVIKALEDIEAHNERYRQGKETYERALNNFAHMRPDEFRKLNMGRKRPENYSHPPEKVHDIIPEDSTRSRRALQQFPKYWNWADKGIIQPAQNQKDCGACYAFAGVAAIEAHACLYNGQCTKLSEQEALECTEKCDGGWDTLIYDYAKNKTGCARENDHPYVGEQQLSQCDADIKNNPRAKNTKVVDFGIMPNHTHTIMYHLYNNGPMMMGMKAYDDFLYFNGVGVYDNPKGEWGWHVVLLVGYGNENGIPYWIIKNSWDTTWGQNGFGKIRRGIDLCNCESDMVSYPKMEKV